MPHILSDFKRFLDTSPTSWHAVKEIGNRLATCDYTPLPEEEKWELERGKKYFVTRDGSLCAFCIPQKEAKRAILLASHTDSPALKLKPLPGYQTQNMIQFGVEIYGGPLLTSWLNRDLILAGRVVVTDGNDQPQERLVIIDDAVFFIPQLAIHLDREVNEKGVHLNKQEHLCPIIGISENSKTPTDALEKLLRRHISFHSLLSFELFLVPQEPSQFVGMDNEMIASYRLDNLASAHAALTAIAVSNPPPDHLLQMALFSDNEESGSNTKESADSPFLSDVMSRIAHCLKMNAEELMLMKNQSLCVSIDMAHALNPNYPQKSEPHHLPLLGKGISIKHSANQKYATNALSSAVIVHACQKLNIPYQPYVCRSDIPSGSTVGPIIAQTTGINTVDIGCPQLSMHSIREAMACQDYLDMIRLLTHLMQEG